MALWAVYNGWMAESAVCALVSSPTEEDARMQAREAFARECEGWHGRGVVARRKSYCETVSVERIDLPVVWN